MNRKNHLSVLFVSIVIFVMLPTFVCADPATIVRETIVRAEAGNQFEQVGLLAAEHEVDLIERQGGWYLVEFEGQAGWVPLLSVRKSSGHLPEKQKGSGLRGLLSTFRTGSSGVTVATGVRGLDAVDLKNSKPNMEELARLNQFVSNEESARAYALQTGLTSREIDWIQAEKKGR